MVIRACVFTITLILLIFNNGCSTDNGINVLLDHAHQFTFFVAWDIPPLLREGGFREQSSND